MATELPFLEPLRRLLGVELHELASGFIAGEVPLTNAVVTRMVNRYLAASTGPVSAVQIEALDGDRIEAVLSLRNQKLISSVKIAARVVQQPAFPHAPVLALEWTMPGLGALASFAAPIVASFKSLPPGMRIDSDRVTINIQEALTARGMGELMHYIATFQVTTRPGSVVVAFALTIRS